MASVCEAVPLCPVKVELTELHIITTAALRTRLFMYDEYLR